MVPFEHSAIIAYKVEDSRVDITDVFYGGRDYEAFYLGTSIDDEGSDSAIRLLPTPCPPSIR